MKIFIIILFTALFFAACAKRPDAIDAAELYNQWIANHSGGDAEIIGETDVIPEIEQDTDLDQKPDYIDYDHDYDNDHDIPNLEEPGTELTDDEDVPDEDIDSYIALTCTASSCKDSVTGLSWIKDASYSATQGESATFCSGLGTYDSLGGWRLPTKEELKTIRLDCFNDSGCGTKPACYWDSQFIGGCDKLFWSSTPGTSGYHYALDFKTGMVTTSVDSTILYARCVTDSN